ncbi:unnamed protein product [Parnassius mnemosyne]|uniref:Major facilitator superfamily (MFS) profile domain-containing protein n=1 Tax=Parnassius mnemosyne TaxID=213953 RepID=A0AAV1LJ25_9NEOP
MVSPVAKQTWAISAVLINMMAQGLMLSYPSSLLPGIRAPDSDIKVDLNTASWLGSVVGLSSIPGFFISSILMDWRGRKMAQAIVIIPGILGWLFIYLGASVTSLIIGRLLTGFTGGASVCLGAVIVGEYSSPKNRGTYLNLKTASVCVGGMMIHILGNFFHWRTVALLSLFPYIISLAIIYTWPESPAWLVSRKEFEKSKKAFYWLRGHSEEAEKELYELIRAQKNKPADIKNSNFKEKFIEFLKKFTRKDFVKPVVIIMFSRLLLETCGRHIFPAYALQIIGEVTGNKSQSFYYTLALDIIITTSATFSSVLVKICKRRTLLFVSGFSALFILFSVCTYLYLASKAIISNNYTWIPISLFVLYFILANLGCTPIPLALLGEVLPLAHRGSGSAVAGIVMSLTMMVALQITPYLLESVKVYGTFAVFGSAMGLTLVVFYFILPETKDRTLQEIEDYFNYGRFKNEENLREEEEDVKMKMII